MFSAVSFTGGTATVTATLDKAGTQTITASDLASTISGTSGSVTVTPVAANKLLVATSPSTLSAGSTTSVSITAEDQYNNVVTSFGDSVTLSDSLGGANFNSASFTGGIATVTSTLDKAGTQTITASDSAATMSGTSGSVTVTPAAASKLLVSAAPSSLTAGSTTSVSITAEDQYNNVVTGFSDSVTLSDSLGGLSSSAVSFSSGKATVTATLDAGGTQTITAVDTSASTISGTSSAITVSPFAVSGSTLTIYGSSGADNLSFAPAANNSFTVTMDSYTATYGFSAIQTIDFIGEGGSDTTNLTLPANCTVNMTPDSATVTGSSAQPFTLSVIQSPLIIVRDNAASTSSIVYIYGASTGTNTFFGTSAYSFLEGPGYTNLEYGFQTVAAYSELRAWTRPI